MLRSLVVAILVCGVAVATRSAEAQPASPEPVTPVASAEPIRVAIVCEVAGRTKACPAFLTGFVEQHPVLLASPRAGADVVLYASASEVALIDRIHLRFVGRMPEAPPVLEIDVAVDTRATDDAQRAALAPAFLRGIAIYVAVRHPAAVTTGLAAPAGGLIAAADSSPWGIMLELSGSGSYTDRYRSASAEAVLVGRYVTKPWRALSLAVLSGKLNRQPPLLLDDGTLVSLDSEEWQLRFGAEVVHSFDDTWSLGVGSYTVFQDPKGQYDLQNRTRAALEYDLFRPDDPRGNRLGVFYHLGWQVERYNLRNELGEGFAQFPVHGIDAVGSVRKDHLTFGLALETVVQLDHPGRRHQLTAAPFTTIQLGNHVDLSLTLSVTRRRLPAPDPAVIDPSDFEQLSRLSFTEPLSLTGTISLKFHWDPTNGVRNNRIESI
jgi:hypothetical protein